MNKNTTNYRHSITIKDSAIEKINSIKNRKGGNYLLKIEVVAGGCKEYQYIFSLEELENIQDFSYLESGDKISTIEGIEGNNTTMDSQNYTDYTDIKTQDDEGLNKQIETFCNTFETKILQTILVANSYTINNNEENKYYIIIKDSVPFILIDKKSFAYLSDNSYLEYQSNMTSAIFNLVNDNVLSSCGCGTSFQIKS